MTQYEESGLGWLFTPDLKEATIEDERSFFENPNSFREILEIIQDGVSIVDIDLTIKYMNNTMRHIYHDKKNALGQKCFKIYHDRDNPCLGCPTIKTIKTKSPCLNTMKYEHDGNKQNWHQVFSIPMVNKKDKVILVVEYIRDITFQNNILTNMKELTLRLETMEYRNQILADILSRQEQRQDEFERTITVNIERFIKPSLEYLKKTVREEDVNMVSGLIDEIIYPITKKRDSLFFNLTPRELQVAALIKEGNSSKEIADKLCITQKAVDFHRLNIRKKLKIKRRNNLRSFLETHL
jgi:DNA-binding CsgD family transcriptional regulator